MTDAEKFECWEPVAGTIDEHGYQWPTVEAIETAKRLRRSNMHATTDGGIKLDRLIRIFSDGRVEVMKSIVALLMLCGASFAQEPQQSPPFQAVPVGPPYMQPVYRYEPYQRYMVVPTRPGAVMVPCYPQPRYHGAFGVWPLFAVYY